MSEPILQSQPSFWWPVNSLHRVEIAFAGVDDSTALQLKQRWTRPGPLQLNRFWTARAEARTLLKLLQKAQLQLPAVVALSDLIQQIDDAATALFTTARHRSYLSWSEDLRNATIPLNSWLEDRNTQFVRSQALAKLKREGHDPPDKVTALEIAWEWLETPHRHAVE